jgi:hypothetical protein
VNGRQSSITCCRACRSPPEFLLNDFEARVRHRQVRLRLADNAEKCLLGEMNPLVGLGAAADPSQHIGKVRISFHDVQDDSCIDPEPQT